MEHNPFSYFYCLMHLREKRDSGEELSGLESYSLKEVDYKEIDNLCLKYLRAMMKGKATSIKV